MGKLRQTKIHQRDLDTLPIAKKVLLNFESRPGMRSILNKADKIHASRAAFLALQKKRGAAENEGWSPSVYFPSEYAHGFVNPEVNALLSDAERSNTEIDPDTLDDKLQETDHLAQQVAAMAAWRVGQGIYLFDSEMMSELARTEISNEIPVSVFRRLPEWCVYVEFPMYAEPTEETNDKKQVMDGFFAYCDHVPVSENSTIDGVHESLILMPLFRGPKGTAVDHPEYIFSIAVPLLDGKGASECVEIGLKKFVAEDGADTVFRFIAEAILPVVLYLCSDTPDIEGKFGKPLRGKPSVKIADRIGPSGKVKQWMVGARFGAALRKYDEEQNEQVAGESCASTGVRKRPHLRRAHFHGFWYGPRQGTRDYRYKWLAPTLINVSKSDDIIPAFHEVPVLQ